MRKYVFLLILMVLSLAIGGCTSSSQELKAQLDKEFSLQIGQTALLAGENARITFKEVITDSRCPTGVTCIWAGQVSCLTEVTKDGTTNELVLTLPGSSDPATESFNGYKVAFNVTPYPEAGKQIAQDEYRLALTVSK